MEMTSKELKKTIDEHILWLQDDDKGSRANLSGANLSDAYLSGADLSGANLSGANLSGAVLCDCNLNGAKITYRDETVIIRFEPVE